MARIMLEYTPPTILLGGHCEVFITHVVDPSHFHCQLQKSAGQLNALMDELHVHCTESNPQVEGLQVFELGTPCLAQYSGDQGWYRVIITGLLANGLVEVSFVDYGNNEVVSAGLLRRMKPEFMELPIQAIQCGMSGVASPQGFWSPEHIAQLEDLILEKSFTSSFLSLLEGDSVCCVELLDKSGNSVNKVFGSTTGTLKTQGRSVQSRGKDDVHVSVSNDDRASSRGFREGPSRRPAADTGRERYTSSGSESSASGSRSFGGDRSAPRHRQAESSREFSGNRKPQGRSPRQEGRTMYSDGGWGDGQSPNHQQQRNNQPSSYGRRGQFNGHDDRDSTDYDNPSSQSNQADGNTWASGFNRSRDDGDKPTDMDTSFKCLTLGLGEVVEAYVAFSNSPEEFWIQLSKNTEIIDGLMEELNNMYSAPSSNSLRNAREGAVCAAQFSEDKRWYRAVIKDVHFDQCTVQFVDYGNSEIISTPTLKTLAPKFLSIPVQAIKCNLNSVEKKGSKWSEDAKVKFEELTMDKPLQCELIGPGISGATAVSLTDPSSNIVISQQLIDMGLALPKTKASATGARPKESSAPRKPKENFKEQSIKDGESHQVVVSWMIDPENFWCQIVSTQQDIVNTNTSLQATYKNSAGLTSDDLDKGMPVIAKFSEDGCWYRGQIVNLRQSQAQVLFVDYGNTETVSLSNLQFPLDSAFKIPMLALKCCLKDVKPANGSRWGEKTVPFLESIIGDEALALINEKKGDSYLVDLKSGGKIASQELVKAGLAKSTAVSQNYPKTPLVNPGQEVNVFVTSIDNADSFWCQPSFATEIDLESAYNAPINSLNNPAVGSSCVTKFSGDGLWYRAEVLQLMRTDALVRFIDYGNQETVKQSDLKVVKPEFLGLPAQCFLCSINGITTVDESIKSKFTQMTSDIEIKSKVTGKKGEKYLLDMYTDSGSLLLNELVPQSVTPEKEILKYLPVPNMAGQTFKGYVSATVSIDEFYIQPASAQADLDSMAELTKSKGGTTDALLNPSVGEACLVKYVEDGAWYRGQLANVAGSTAKVLFVDYGNYEDISISDLKMIAPAVLDVPPLAFPCSLAGVMPHSGKWTKEALGLFEDTVMDRELTCQFVTKSSVKMTTSSGDVGTVLISAGHATGSGETKQAANVIEYPAPQPLGPTFQGYISHVHESGIYIQPTANTDLLDKMTNDLQNIAGDLELSPRMANTSSGNPCCAKFSEDNSWYRALILSQSGSKVVVRFVDFGNLDTLSTESLKSLPSKLCNQAPLALQCLPKGKSSLGPDEIDVVNSRGIDKELKVLVHTSKVPYEVDLEDESGSLFPSLENEPAPKTPASVSSSMTITKNRVQPGSFIGYITEIDQAGWIFVQRAGDEDAIASMSEKLQAYAPEFESGAHPIPASNISIGTECSARFTEDEAWYRAQVLNIDNKQATVRFLDFGNKDTSSVSELRAIPTEFMTIPPFCVLFKVEGNFSDKQVAKAMEFVDGKEFEFEITSQTEPFDPKIKSPEGVELFEILSLSSTQVCMEEKPNTNLMATNQSSTAPERASDRIPDKFANPLIPTGIVSSYVAHVETDGVYIHLVRDEENLASLVEKVQDLADGMQPLDAVHEGSICCARFTVDQMWYRATVEECTDGKIKVRFVDYGNDDLLDIGDLRKIDNELLLEPAYALRCNIAGHPNLSDSEVNSLTDQTADQTVHVEFITKSEPCQIRLTFENGTVFQPEGKSGPVEQSRLKADSVDQIVTPQDPVPTKTDKPTDFHQLTFSPGNREEMYVSYSDLPEVFWCHPAASEHELASLMEAIAEYCSQITKEERELSYSTGQVCLAKFSQDQEWYRARVLKLTAGEVEVFFVDYGNSDIVPEGNLCPLLPEHMTLPAQAVPCKLHGMDVSWSPEYMDLFNHATAEKKLLVEIQTCDTWKDAVCYSVNIFDMGENILSKIVPSEKESLDVDTQKRLSNDDISIEKSISQLSLSENSSSTPMTDSLQVQVSDSVAGFSETMDPSLSTIDNSETYTTLPLVEGSRLEIIVSHAISPSQFWIQQKSKTAELTAMMELLSETMGTISPSESEFEVNQPCAAQSSEDGSWYRAIIKEIDVALGVMDVFFVDYGLVETVERDNVRRIPPDFMAQPVQAIECGLSGIRFQGMTWTQEAKMRFEELVLEKTLVATILQVGEEGDCILQLLNTGICVAKTLIEENLGVDSHTPIKTPPHLRRVFPDTPAKSIPLNVEREESIHNRLELRLGDKKSLYISHAESPSDFWCQLSESVSEIDRIMEEVVVECSREITSQGDWEEGQICLAQSIEDQQYYRACIKSLKEDLVWVFYIDYGNTEEVPRSALKLISGVLSSPPGQAIHCSLASIKPEGNNWEETSCSRFQEMTYQKELQATVLDKTGSIYSLLLIDDGVAINDSLVQDGYAARDNLDKTVGLNTALINVNSATPTDRLDIPRTSSGVFGAASPAFNTLESTPFEEMKHSKPKTTTDLPSPISGSENGDVSGPDLDDLSYQTSQLKLSAFNYSEFEENSELAVFVLNIIDPSNFGIQPQSSSVELEKLMADIAAYVEGETTPVANLEVGSPCLAQFSEDELWYRAKISKTQGEQFMVTYIDYGNSELRGESNLLSIPESMLELPVQYVPCCLADIWSDGDNWLPDTTSFFKDMCDEKTLTARVSKEEEGIYHVYLFIGEDHTGWSLNRYLLSKGVELIPGSELEIELETEDTMHQDLESSFNDLSMTKENSFDDCNVPNESDTDTPNESQDNSQESVEQESDTKSTTVEVTQETSESISKLAEEETVQVSEENEPRLEVEEATQQLEGCDSESLLEEPAQNTKECDSIPPVEETDTAEESVREIEETVQETNVCDSKPQVEETVPQGQDIDKLQKEEVPITGENDNAEEDQETCKSREKSATEAEQADEISTDDLSQWEESKDSFS